MSKEEFKELYFTCFDEKGNPRPCPGESIKRLIQACKTLCSTLDFGDEKTGFMQTYYVNSFSRLYLGLDEE